METIVSVSSLKKYFPVREGLFRRNRQLVRAVDDVSFQIRTGETLGLVGESGCGKSTVAHLILRLLEPTAGEISVLGYNLSTVDRRALKNLRRKMQVVFQDPYASLNPRRSVHRILSQPFEVHGLESGYAREQRVRELLDLVGLSPPEQYIDRLPHEFSGGQRQRICIARAIALNPAFIVADEPVSALDVSIRAQILNLMKKIQKDLGLTCLFISHDLNVVRFISDRVAVMYLGQIVELAPESVLFSNPIHPYTKALLSAILSPDPKVSRMQTHLKLSGEVPSPITPPSGCRFHTRCPVRNDSCDAVEPLLTDLGQDHWVRCHLAG